MNKKKVLLIILAVVLIAVGFFAYRVWDDFISPYLNAKGKTLEELKAAADSRNIIRQELGIDIREYTDEEKAEIESGEKTDGEVMEEVIKEAVPKTKEGDIIAKYLSQIYGLQELYTGKIEGIIAEAKPYYYDLRVNQKLDSFAALNKTKNKFYPKANALEGECNGKVNSVLSSMSAELKKNGYGTSIIGEIRNAYQAEKDAKRSYYMGLALN